MFRDRNRGECLRHGPVPKRLFRQSGQQRPLTADVVQHTDVRVFHCRDSRAWRPKRAGPDRSAAGRHAAALSNGQVSQAADPLCRSCRHGRDLAGGRTAGISLWRRDRCPSPNRAGWSRGELPETLPFSCPSAPQGAVNGGKARHKAKPENHPLLDATIPHSATGRTRRQSPANDAFSAC